MLAVPLKVNLRSLVARRTATLLTVLGIGLIVMALTVVWGLQQGLAHVFDTGGDPRNLIVLRDGSDTETVSGLLDENVRIIETLPGIDVGADGKPLVAGEALVIANLPRKGAVIRKGESAWAQGANVSVRGISAQSLALRPEVTIVAGRMLEPGRNEMLAGKPMSERFANCGLGDTLVLRRVPYTIVGVFTAKGSPYESELWADLKDVGATWSREGAVSSVLLRSSDPVARASLAGAIANDQRLTAKAESQKDFFAFQSTTSGPLIWLGNLMTFFLSIGACFAAANTMYASVLSRSREIGTLRALGFSRLGILLAYMAESLAVALMAGILGLILGSVVLLFAGAAGTGNVTFSEVTFHMRVTGTVVIICLVTCSVIGTIGGLMPALRAATMPIVEALRAA
jgi:putative ABC transport system permease protein